MPAPERRRAFIALLASLPLAGWVASARAQSAPRGGMELQNLQVQRTDEALSLSYQVRVDLPKDLEDALLKGLSIVFVARANLYRSRWYWTDKPRVEAERRWRLSYQPLTRHWRVNIDGLSRSYDSLREAMGVMQRAGQWRLIEPGPPPDDREHYLEFSFELDKDELPRPLQLSLGGSSDWNLAVQRRLPVALNR
jgi:Domain of unknown function (DUF4390)